MQKWIYLGADWNDYKGLQKYFGLIAEGTYGNNYSDKFLAYTGFEEKIKTGTTEAIDIGCGNGYHLETFCKNFLVFYEFLRINMYPQL